MKNLNSWVLATRPKTLAAVLVPVFVGTVLAAHTLKTSGNKIILCYSFLAFLSAVFIQIATNLINDALDFKKGADTETRLGPTRVTQSGLLSLQVVLAAGFLCLFISLLFGLPLILHAGWPVLFLGTASLICAYCYTGGPWPIAYLGLGEVFVILFFGFGAVCGTYFIQTGFVTAGSIITGLQIGLLATVLIAINNFRDFIADKKVYKLTLAARFGKRFARFEILSLFLLAYALNVYWILNGFLCAGLLPFLTLPFAVYITYGVFRHEPSVLFNKFLGLAALTEILFGICLSIGFLA